MKSKPVDLHVTVITGHFYNRYSLATRSSVIFLPYKRQLKKKKEIALHAVEFDEGDDNSAFLIRFFSHTHIEVYRRTC